MQSPASGIDIEAEISPPVGVVLTAGVTTPEVVVPRIESVVRNDLPGPSLEAPPPPPPVRKTERRARSKRPDSPPVAQLSLVRVTNVEQARIAGVRAAVERKHEVLRACCESVMRGSPVKGKVFASITVRSRRVTTVTVDSTSRDTSLRWCFRKHLMGLSVPQDDSKAGFDARLEFFLLPRRPWPAR